MRSLTEVTRILEDFPDRYTPTANLASFMEAESVVAAIDADPRCTKAEATKFASQLLWVYPNRGKGNEAYMTAIVAMFMMFPGGIVKRTCDPVAGLPSTLAYLPSIAEVKAALDQNAGRRDLIRAAALTTMQEWRRRDAAAQEPQETAEQKAAAVARWKAIRGGGGQSI